MSVAKELKSKVILSLKQLFKLYALPCDPK